MLNRFVQFTILIKMIHRDIQKVERQELSKYGYKGSYAQYLILLHRYPHGITMSELCHASGLDKAAVSRAISEMEYQSLVERTYIEDHPHNSLIFLTDNGRTLTNHILKCISLTMEKITEKLSEEERHCLLPALERVREELEVLAEEDILATAE